MNIANRPSGEWTEGETVPSPIEIRDGDAVPATPHLRRPTRAPPPKQRLRPEDVLVRALNGADPLEGFWSLWFQHQNVLRGRSLRLSGGSVTDAEDALSDAMVRAAQAYREASLSNQRAWLLKILHNVCMDHHRRRSRLGRFADKSMRNSSSPMIDADAPVTPEEALSRAQAETAIGRGFSALPEHLREPLKLHLDGAPDEEIAQRFEVTREVVRKRRQLARDRLRASLAG